MIRAALSFMRSYFCAEESRMFLTLDGRAQVSAIVEAFRPVPNFDAMTLRLTIHDKTALTAFINDPNGSIELEVSPATMRAFSQFLLRRLRQEGNQPATFFDDRHSAEGKDHAEKESRPDWRRHIYREDGGPCEASAGGRP